VIGVVPVKGFASGKTRLSSALSDARRRELIVLWATRALDALTGAGLRPLVITADAEVAAWALSHQADVFEDPPGTTLATAIDAALTRLAGDGEVCAMVLMADLPDIDSPTLRMLPASTSPVWVPSRAGTGTNAAVIPLPAAARTAFGDPRSLSIHRERFGGSVLPLKALARDVDTPQDL
jgi:2-phospho-L-lactate guanylyltransferase